ncbi:MAG: helix-hairpin-helix domain-containing protein [Colwellia sp.]|uniref:ComEA family DNA-binding protein n=1 Tax=Colwellia sp. TaxID=56799 RepID=UPI001DED51D9|nr:helix-hairpin-helix domain-containing protein [Colwellia sp.]NQY50056.1 helix-hairpin-helix domain-containing protein [Colwellia sp.]
MKKQLKVLSRALFTASLALLLSISTVVSHAKEVSSTSLAKVEVVQQQAIVNINKSTFDQLLSLKGIGHTKARAIIVYRQQFGGFKSIDELTKVSGIGEKTVNVNKSRLTI